MKKLILLLFVVSLFMVSPVMAGNYKAYVSGIARDSTTDRDNWIIKEVHS